jgi:hypothetical protein
VDPFVPPLGAGSAVPAATVDASEPALVMIEATMGDGRTLSMRASEPLSLYLLRESDDATLLLFPLPGRRQGNPLDAGLRHRIAVATTEGVVALAATHRSDEFERRVAALRVPRAGPLTEVPLPSELVALLRARVGLPQKGRLIGRAAPLGSGPEVVRGAWLRRLGEAR